MSYMISDSESVRSPFENSSLVRRSPPNTPNLHREEPTMYHSCDGKTACIRCNVSDVQLKLKCTKCLNWMHATCNGYEDGVNLNEIDLGKWVCYECDIDIQLNKRPESVFASNKIGAGSSTLLASQADVKKGAIPKSNYNIITRTRAKKKNSTDDPKKHDNVVNQTNNKTKSCDVIIGDNSHAYAEIDRPAVNSKQNSMHRLEDRTSNTSKKTSRSKSSMYEEMVILERQKELNMKAIQTKFNLEMIEEEQRYLQQKRKLLSEMGSSKSSILSDEIQESQHRLKDTASWVERNRKVKFNALQTDVSKANKMYDDSDTKLPKNKQGRGEYAEIADMNLTVDDFLSVTLNNQAVINDSLTKDQARARYVVAKELPEFYGDPKHWPAFIMRFKESTSQCGFTQSENLDRLARSLKGQALEAVRSQLHSVNGLPSVLATLKMLYGRPEIVYDSLMQLVRSSPTIKEDKFDTIVMYAMRVRNLCDTLEIARMDSYLNNPLLLSDLVSRLPAALKMNWGSCKRSLEVKGEFVNVESFNMWIKEQAEIASSVCNEALIQSRASSPSKGTKVKKQSQFQIYRHEETSSEKFSKSWEEICHCCQNKGHVTAKCSRLINASSEKRWILVKKNYLCIRCLGKHMLRNCGSDSICGRDNCQQPHHPMLHADKFKNKNRSTLQNYHEVNPNCQPNEIIIHTSNETDDNPVAHNINAHCLLNHTTFQIVPVILSNGRDEEISTYAFLDSGSEITLIEQNVIERLGIKGKKEKMTLKWTSNIKREEPNSHRVNLYISNINRVDKFQLKGARTVEELCLPNQSISGKLLKSCKHLNTLPIHNYINAKPQILIGLDHYQLLTPQETIEGTWDEPVAVRTRLGWTAFGSLKSANDDVNLINIHADMDADLHSMVDKYFSLDNIGILHPRQEVESIEDVKARCLMDEYIYQRSDGRYVTPLLWRSSEVILPDSYRMAERRLLSLEKKLARDHMLRETFNTQITEYHRLGFLKELTEQELEKSNNKIWYLPMFLVSNPNKPGKHRLVWDAAAKVNGRSLNSFLFTGPDLLTSLSSILVKFRERRYAVAGDIEKMYHQILIKEEDQTAQRCLWRNSAADKIRISKMTVMTFGAACSPSTAQYVKNKNAEKFKDRHPRAVEAILNRHYVDDYVDSFSDIKEAKDTIQQVIEIHKSGGFNIRNFISNNNEVISQVNEIDLSERKLLILDNEHSKILGMWWDCREDILSYKINIARIGEELIAQKRSPTKREVLRTIMTLFDPLGILGYFLIKGKLILKAIWRSSIDWDQPIQNNELVKWKQWMIQLTRLDNVRVSRWYFTDSQFTHYEIHTFVDAGEDAAAAVVYIVKVSNKCRESALVISKTKVAPNRPTSIPRMELQAAVIGSRLTSSIIEQLSLGVSKCTYWTDSRNVLCWLRCPRRFKTFVAHRVGEIRESTRVSDWRWVPSQMNPADYGTKWTTCDEKMPDLWRTGPTFLVDDEDKWPVEPENLPPIDEEVLEMRCNIVSTVKVNDLIPDMNRFSLYSKLLNTQVFILKYFYRKKDFPIINPESLKRAEEYLIRSAQMLEYREEVSLLKEYKPISKNSKIFTYSPFLDENHLLRMKSRLSNAEYLSYDQKYPIILPQSSILTNLIIDHYHRKFNHANHSTVLNELKQKFVISSLRAKIKTIRMKCQLCRLRSAKPEIPEMSSLPMSRLAVGMKPFTYTGVDYFGPMNVKHGRRIEKRWGCIFTCLTTRAVHIEIASTLSSDTFILVMRCFISRRGQPLCITSDNGTNFRGAATELKRVAQINAEVAMQDQFCDIKWMFNPPSAPHMGGAWERLIRSIKQGLKCLLNQRTPTEETLRSVLAEIEMIINSRPLTYVETSEGSIEALTPNHFLLGSSSGVKPISDFSDDASILRQEYKKQQYITQLFWKRFICEYLPEISRRTKWYDPIEPIKIGDVVAIVNESMPNSWQLGKVVEVVVSKDGNVRQAMVKTSNGILKRPSSKLAVLIRSELRDVTHSSAGGSVTN